MAYQGLFNENNIRIGILLSIWLEYFWNMYLNMRQYNVMRKSVNVPREIKSIMSQEVFDKSRSYGIAKEQYSLIKHTYFQFISIMIIHLDVLPYVWEYSESLINTKNEIYISCLWIIILSTVSTIIELPIDIYRTFVIEENYGFNKQTAAFFIWDTIKSFILFQILAAIISAVVILTIKNSGENFFIYLWLVVCIISILLMLIYPSFIQPIFDKFTPLPDGELRTQIEHLASQLQFPLKQLFLVEGSKRSSHSNAYVVGMFNTKRIVIYDTLLKHEDGTGCSNEEILAILGHELGHWKHSHVVKQLVLMQVNCFLLFTVFSFMFQFEPIYRAFGFYNTKPVLVGLIIVLKYVMSPYNHVTGFVMNCLARQFEYQADIFAVHLGRGEALCRGLIQLYKDNLAFPILDHLYSAWYYDHPGLLERIEAVNNASSSTKKD